MNMIKDETTTLLGLVLYIKWMWAGSGLEVVLMTVCVMDSTRNFWVRVLVPCNILYIREMGYYMLS